MLSMFKVSAKQVQLFLSIEKADFFHWYLDILAFY